MRSLFLSICLCRVSMLCNFPLLDFVAAERNERNERRKGRKVWIVWKRSAQAGWMCVGMMAQYLCVLWMQAKLGAIKKEERRGKGEKVEGGVLNAFL
ncbi:MAG: hypothetical protein BYD32DRAFT_419469 [Podila humilis]|nr:MAG: hypothetical protein BYD32DRAFT_419469 [Podila humilis]